MKPIMRLYRNQDDYWRIRAFLREVFVLNGRRELSWPAYRFDFWRWHGIENCGHGRLEEDLFLWETPDGRIAAVLNPESTGAAFLQVHPALRSAALEEEMVSVAEQHLAILRPDGRRELRVFAHEHDPLRQEILARRGYTQTDEVEQHHCWPLSIPVPVPPVAAGCAVRALGDEEELAARSLASWQAFHAREPDERYEGWEWYRNLQRAPLYRRDLDLVAVAPGAPLQFASFCTVWFDDVTRTGAFEPVGTAAVHRRRGLGRAVMYEGLRRLKRLGATMAYVGAEAVDTHAFYTSVGFTTYLRFRGWVKEW